MIMGTSNTVATRLTYLDEFNVINGNAQVNVLNATDEEHIDLVLDQTCFYPRGGGQDWDTGTISDSESEFVVEEVRMDENGTVHHIGTFAKGEFSVGQKVVCEVNAERRLLNTRLHSAGHLIDLAADQLNLPWIPGRGAHYPHMSFVEYNGEWNAGEASDIQQEIEGIINEIVAVGGENEIRFMPVWWTCGDLPRNNFGMGLKNSAIIWKN